MSSEWPSVPPQPDRMRSEEGPGPAVAWRFVHPGSMGAIRIVGAGLRLWAAHWAPWFVVTFALTGVIAVVAAAVDPWSATYGWPVWVGDRPTDRDPNGLAIVLTLVSVFFLGLWELVILTRAALSETLTEPPRGSRLIGSTVRGVLPMLWVCFLLGLAGVPLFLVVVGIADAMGSADARNLLAFVPLGLFLWIGARLATLTHVFVGEDARGTRAIVGAWRLSRGAWATSAGVLVLSFLISIAVTILPGVIAADVFPDAVATDAVGRTIVQSLLNALLTPMWIAILAALYLELRARAGLLDQAILRGNVARFDRG
jgi:hypothetical protein